MENECEYVKKQKKKDDIKKYLISVFIIILLTICICKGNFSIYLKNTEKQFDNSIMWSAIGAIGSIAAFIGVILTIRYTEKSRIKQNQVDYEKEKLLTEQIEFKHTLKRQLEILNPVNIILESNYVNVKNYEKIHQDIITYMSRLNLIELELYWYYDRTMRSSYIELNKFIKSINDYKSNIKNKFEEYLNTLGIFQAFEKTNLYSQLDKLNGLSENEKNEYEKMKVEINFEIELTKMADKRHHIMREISSITDLTIGNLYEEAKLVVEERNNIIQRKINR